MLVTIDCDGQHEPQRIPRFAAACHDVDIVSGSRYLKKFAGDSPPPAQRQRINQRLTAELNQRLGLQLTDAFCGFKAYRVAALKQLRLQETGYAMPLELWVQAVALGLRIVELPVPLIYLEEERSFGGMLDDADTRLRYYYEVLDRSIRRGGAGRAGRGRPVAWRECRMKTTWPIRLPTNACVPLARMGSRCAILRSPMKRPSSTRIWRCDNRPIWTWAGCRLSELQAEARRSLLDRARALHGGVSRRARRTTWGSLHR